MGFLDILIGPLEEDRNIEDDLNGYAPEDREEYLMSVYGRTKEEFPGVDFGDDLEQMSEELDDIDDIDDIDEDIDDIEDSDADYDFDSSSDSDDLW